MAVLAPVNVVTRGSINAGMPCTYIGNHGFQIRGDIPFVCVVLCFMCYAKGFPVNLSGNKQTLADNT